MVELHQKLSPAPSSHSKQEMRQAALHNAALDKFFQTVKQLSTRAKNLRKGVKTRSGVIYKSNKLSHLLYVTPQN